MDVVTIYNKVESVLTEKGYILSKIIKTNADELLTQESVVLYTFIFGEIYKNLTKRQTENAIKYIKKFNTGLSDIIFDPQEIKDLDVWDKAKSLDFLINHFVYTYFPLEDENIMLIKKAIQTLTNNKKILSEASKQLIHADLGPDNFIFKNDEVYSVIDFTPEYENELYSLCQFCYWNYYWVSTEDKEDERLMDDLLKTYYDRKALDTEKEFFKILMIKASLFRIAGPLMNGNINLEKRFDILKRVIKTCM